MIRDIDVLAREWGDPHVAADHELARMMDPPAPWERVVVLGDSIAEGMSEPMPGYRDLSWVDRISAAFTFARPGTVVFNLGRRDLTAAEIRATQLERALSLRPGLAIVTAGGNDTLRRRYDPDVVEAELRTLIGSLRDAGADVVTMDMYEWDTNPYMSERFAPIMAPRLTAVTEIARSLSAELGTIHCRLRDGAAARDPDRYCSDGLHLNARGHGILATDLARTLGDPAGRLAAPDGRQPASRAGAR